MIFEKINCPICDSDKVFNWKSWIEQNHKFQVGICKNCGFVYQNPRIREKDIDEFYKEFYFTRDEKYNETYSSIISKEIRKGFHIYNFIELNVLDMLNKDSINMLEVGCSYLRSSYTIKDSLLAGKKNKKLRVNCTGLDPNKQNADDNIIKETFEEFSKKTKKKFDIIIFCHVYEHFYDIKKIPEMINKLLKDDGIAYIEVPSFHTGSYKTENLIEVAEHFSFFTKKSLFNNLGAIGNLYVNKIVESSTHGNLKAIVTKRKYLGLYTCQKENYVFTMLKYYRGILYRYLQT